jgi:NADH-quinone oxidoreductase subunit H
MISYELALGLSLIGPILLAGSLDLTRIVEIQSRWHGTGWLILFTPLSFVVYIIAAIAETNRVPFDLPEAETELVAGFHTEYSAMKFALFFLAEYINMFTVSMLATTVFWGGWNVPFADYVFGRGTFLFALVSVIGFLLKVIVFLFIYIWVRGTLPRFRFDQLMSFGWKFLLPLALLSIFITATLIFLNVL